MNQITRAPRSVSLEPSTLSEAMTFAEMLARSTMVPRDFQGKPENVLVAIQWGREIGLGPLQALQNIAVIGGRPSVWGDAMLALVRGAAVCAYVRESIEGDGENIVATCRCGRRGEDGEVVSTFSVADAKKAGLWGKQGPWQQYPKRMLQMRARGFALRDAFPDVLRGVITAEEAADIPANVPFAGTTIDAEPVGHGQPRDTARAIGDELPPSATDAAPQPKKPTAREWLDSLENELMSVTEADEVDRIVCRDQVQAALDNLRNGSLERLKSIIRTAQERTASPVIDNDPSLAA